MASKLISNLTFGVLPDVANTLGHVGCNDRKAVEALSHVLSSSRYSEVRYECAKLLGCIESCNNELAVKSLFCALNDPVESVRLAVRSLGNFRNDSMEVCDGLRMAMRKLKFYTRRTSAIAYCRLFGAKDLRTT
jgi:hypothetical protein